MPFELLSIQIEAGLSQHLPNQYERPLDCYIFSDAGSIKNGVGGARIEKRMPGGERLGVVAFRKGTSSQIVRTKRKENKN